jgi:Phosphorylase superfamily
MILVPQGAEHRAVCKGLQRVSNPPTVFPVPVGAIPLLRHLKTLHESGCFYEGQHILIMGLCGGLVPSLTVGSAVLYQNCASTIGSSPLVLPPSDLTSALQAQLKLPSVNAITSDRVISTPTEKHNLAHQFDAQVVDMEGYIVLDFLTQFNAMVSTLRVVSDDCRHSIPNLAEAFSPTGDLQPLKLAIAMLSQPIAATRLIRGSLLGLSVLEKMTQKIFT